MIWKYLKLTAIILLALAIIIPSILYIIGIDWSKKHSSRIDALPLFNSTINEGEYRLQANDLEFLVRARGMQNEGPAVILLHGFPESSIMWNPLLDAAAKEGYRVIAFDQRGYSPGARPSGIKNYEIDHLVSDVFAIADEIGFDTFHLVGHDWGAAVGWKATLDFPERVHTWTALSIPHLQVFFDALANDEEQQKRSAYMDKLRMPIVPEFLFALFQNSIFESVAEVWTEEQIVEYKSMHRDHGALSAALNWYRANDADNISQIEMDNKITRPTLFIWGSEDDVVAPHIITKQEALIDAPYRSLKLHAGHSLMQEKEDSIIQAIVNDDWKK